MSHRFNPIPAESPLFIDLEHRSIALFDTLKVLKLIDSLKVFDAEDIDAMGHDINRLAYESFSATLDRSLDRESVSRLIEDGGRVRDLIAALRDGCDPGVSVVMDYVSGTVATAVDTLQSLLAMLPQDAGKSLRDVITFSRARIA
jgi:hypothetical protein